MTSFSYNRDIPDGPHNPSTDQPMMKVNTNSTADLIGVDHVTFSLPDGGYHTDIHCLLQSPAPTSTAGLGQIYYAPATTPAASKNFFMDNGVRPFQMTGGLQAQNGYGWAGGILFQWGFDTANAGNNTITLPVAFPNNFYNVTATITSDGAAPGISGGLLGVYIINPLSASLTSFNINVRGASAPVVPNSKIFWQAIGN